MRPPRILLIACALLVVQCHSTALNAARAQESAAAKDIESTIRQYFTSMSKRDVEGLRAVLDTRFVAIEAGNPNAKVHVSDTAKAKEMLPPQGNDDWDNVRLSDVKAKTSTTHPSVAIASFTLSFPLDAKTITQYEALLKSNQPKLDDAQRKILTQLIKDRAIDNSMFAMLAQQRGKWKIICMSFPK